MQVLLQALQFGSRIVIAIDVIHEIHQDHQRHDQEIDLEPQPLLEHALLGRKLHEMERLLGDGLVHIGDIMVVKGLLPETDLAFFVRIHGDALV